MKLRRLVAVTAVGALAATGLGVLGAGPAGAGLQDPFQADAQLKIKGVTGFVGDGIFDTRVGQSLSTAASPAQKAVFVFRAENEGNKKSRLELWVDDVDCDGPADIQLFFEGQNVSEQMFVDELEVGGVPPGGHVDVRLKVKVGPGAGCDIELGTWNERFGGQNDYVYAGVVSTQGGGPS